MRDYFGQYHCARRLLLLAAANLLVVSAICCSGGSGIGGRVGEIGWMPSATLSPISPQIDETPLPTILASTLETKQKVVFSQVSADKSLPSDIRQELEYFSGGGGGLAPECWQSDGAPSLYLLRETLTGVAGDWLALIYGSFCDFEVGDTILVTINDPLGRVIYQETLIAQDGSSRGFRSYAELKYQLPYAAPSGDYIITATTGSGTIIKTVNAVFQEAKSPVAVIFDNHIELYNLAPNERVRLFGYGEDGQFLSWAAAQVDAKGNGTVILEDIPCPRVLGDISGLIPHLADRCESRLQTEMRHNYAVVTTDEGAAPVYAVQQLPQAPIIEVDRVTSGTWVELVSILSYPTTDSENMGSSLVQLPDGIRGEIASSLLRPPIRLMVLANKNDAPIFSISSVATDYECPAPDIVGSVPSGTELRPALWEIGPYYCVTSGIRYWRLEGGHAVRADDVVVVPVE
jgi:hypothetical protein